MKKIVIVAVICSCLLSADDELADYNFEDHNQTYDYDEVRFHLIGQFHISDDNTKKRIRLNYDKTPIHLSNNKVAIDLSDSSIFIEGKSKRCDPKVGVSFKF